MLLSLGDWLLLLAALFLISHVALDVRSLYRNVRHPQDLAWSVITLAVLVGHLAFDFL